MPLDLVTQPVFTICQGNRTTRVGLAEMLLRAHEFDGLSGYVPPVESALLRLLVTLASRVTGLDRANTTEPMVWHERRNQILAAGTFTAEKVETYFRRYAGRFDLFDSQRPFLQDPRLRDECPTTSGINRLVPYRATGNTQPWMCHLRPEEAVPVAADEAVGWLLMQHHYGPSGGGTVRSGWHYLKSGPLRGASSVFLTGETLFQTLVLNIPDPQHTTAPAGRDLAPWEADELPDPIAAPTPTWPAGLLVGRSTHALLLCPNAEHTAVVDCYLTWAHRDSPAPATDPYLAHWAPKDTGEQPGWTAPLSANGSRPLWRDLDAILGPRTGKTGTTPPSIITQTTTLPTTLVEAVRLRVLAFEQDSQTKDYLWFSATTPPVLAHSRSHDPQAAEHIQQLAAAADRIGGLLRWSLVQAWEQVFGEAPKRGPSKVCRWSEEAEALYWPDAEALFWRHLAEGTLPEPLPATAFAEAARRALRTATDRHSASPRVVLAIATADQILRNAGRPPVAKTRKAKAA